MDNWIRWVVELLLFVVVVPLVGWIFHRQDQLAQRQMNFDKELAVLQSRPYVDPVAYTKLITELTSAMTALTSQVAELSRVTERTLQEHARQTDRQFAHVEKQIEGIRAQLEQLSNSLQET